MSIKKKAKKLRNDLFDTLEPHLSRLDPEIVLYVMAAEMLDLSLAAAKGDPHVALNEAFGAMQIVAAERGYNLQFSKPTVH